MLKLKLLFFVFCLFSVNHLLACRSMDIKAENLTKAITMALKLHTFLEKEQPEIALVARVGSDLSRYQMVYSHMGIVMRSHPQGKWIFIHLLNHCGSNKAALFDEGLIPFFNDRPFRYQALVIFLKPALQQKIKQVLLNGTAEQLFDSDYNMLASPYKQETQNSNQWVLEVIASAQSYYLNATERLAAQRILALSGYQGEKIKLSFWQKLGSIFKDNVNLNEQNNQKNIEFVSVRSVISYLEAQQQIIFKETILLTDQHPIKNRKTNKNKAMDAFWGRY